MPNRQAVQGVRTGGRSAQVREAVLAAALEALLADGYAALSMEAVAARAGVNKTTVYRRWLTLDNLVSEALAAWSEEAVPIPDTGSLQSDLLALGRLLADQLNAGVGRQVAAAMLTAGDRSARLVEATRQFFDRQRLRATPLVSRAVGRGELPAGVDAEAMLAAFRAPFFYRLVTTGDPIDDCLVEQAARVVLAAAQSGALSLPCVGTTRPLALLTVSQDHNGQEGTGRA